MQNLSELLNSRTQFNPRIKLIEISENSGVSIGAVCGIASGKVRNPRYSTALRLIEAMKCLRKGRRKIRVRKEGGA